MGYAKYIGRVVAACDATGHRGHGRPPNGGLHLLGDRSARGRECQCLREPSGGGIALSAVQELVRRGDPVPSHMVLISPALDLTLGNPAIQSIDDPFLPGIRSCETSSNSGPATLISPIPWSAPCMGYLLGFRRPRSTSETWMCSRPTCLSSKTTSWRRRTRLHLYPPQWRTTRMAGPVVLA